MKWLKFKKSVEYYLCKISVIRWRTQTNIDSRSKKEVIKVHEMAKIQMFEGKIHQGN